jgi:transcriptional regulator with XRE-family HTH domain
MRVGDRMAIAARLRGVTQAEIAKRLNVSTSAVSSWAKEGRNPPSKRIPEIADILGVSAEYLLTGKDEPPDFADNYAAGKIPDEQTNKPEISECLTIIKAQQSTIAVQSASLADMIANNSRLVEVIAVSVGNNKKQN